MLRNVTITLDEEALKWARVEAAKQGISLSKLLAGFVQEKAKGNDAYWQAYERWKKIKPVKTKGSMPIPREAAYERGH